MRDTCPAAATQLLQILALLVALTVCLPAASARNPIAPLLHQPRSLLQTPPSTKAPGSSSSSNSTAQPGASEGSNATAPAAPPPAGSATAGNTSNSRTGGDGGASVTVVRSARALQEAVGRGDAHIEIQAHIDLTSLKPPSKGLLLGVVPPTVRSIQVRSLECSLGLLFGTMKDAHREVLIAWAPTAAGVVQASTVCVPVVTPHGPKVVASPSLTD